MAAPARRALAPLALLMAGALALPAWADPPSKRITKDADGLVKVAPLPIDKSLQNTPWPAEMEKGFWERANHHLEGRKGNSTPRTDGEGEKWAYPALMLDYLAGFKEPALAGLQGEDQQAGDNAFTQGIDFYWCFTLKGQARKYFMFGEELAPAYKKRMFEGAKTWTAEDPRPMLELVLALESPYPAARAYAAELLKKMGANSKNVGKAAEDPLLKERAKVFVEFVQKAPPEMEGVDYGTDVAKWRAWWDYWAKGGWMVFEEFERVINPTPHPKFGVGTGPTDGQAWQASVRGGIVDPRCTDNLRAMRETTVYLFAEETGNEKVRQLYKEKIRRYVYALYTIGMGEWDSENYHAHTFTPYLNLYDYAKDPEVKLLAKAGLDWLTAAAALKYYRGGYGGPTKRDYGGARKVFGSGPAHLMYLYAGDCPIKDPDPQEDEVHAITSTYRPPLAAIGLARKDFKKPAELWSTKPTYTNWTPGADDAPETWETLFYGDTYYLGTCVSAGSAGDVGAFRLLAWNGKRGVDYFIANTGKAITSNKDGKRRGDQIGQYRNLCIYLRSDDKGDPFLFQVPASAKVEKDDGVWYIGMEKTYLAVRPINLTDYSIAPFKGREAQFVPDDRLMTAPRGPGLGGFALEIGEQPAYASLDAFKQAVKAKGKLDLSGLAEGKVVLTGTDGRKLEMVYNKANDLPTVIRDGQARDWAKELDLYKPVGGTGPISLGWKQGTLRIEAGGKVFTQTVTKDGEVTFEEK